MPRWGQLGRMWGRLGLRNQHWLLAPSTHRRRRRGGIFVGIYRGCRGRGAIYSPAYIV